MLRVSVLIQSLTLGVSFPSLLYFLYIFWFPCFVSLRNRSACSVEQMNQTKSSLIVAQIYTQHTWGKRENAKTSGPTELQWQNIKEKQGECLCGTSELGGFRKEKA